MSTAEQNWERDIAKDFILNTNRNIFLTGKAGTGKTTLLKEVLKKLIRITSSQLLLVLQLSMQAE